MVEPSSVLIRHFGQSGELEEPPATSITLSSAQQAIVHWEMSRRGWGPKIYGFFAGGRLEEYIESHTLQAAESTQPGTAQHIARSYARLHSLQLPLRRNSYRLIIQEFTQSIRDKQQDVVRKLLTVEEPIAKEYASIFEELDWAKELGWVFDLFQRNQCKVTVSHGDANYLNILIREAETENRAVLIDYETVAYNYRGIDIGGHFNERLYCYDQHSTQLSGYPEPSLKEQQDFCKAYLDEMRDLGQDMTGTDTVEHLLLEAAIGRLYQLLFANLMCTFFDKVETEPLFLSGLVHMMTTYKRFKAEFLATYGQ